MAGTQARIDVRVACRLPLFVFFFFFFTAPILVHFFGSKCQYEIHWCMSHYCINMAHHLTNTVIIKISSVHRNQHPHAGQVPRNSDPKLLKNPMPGDQREGYDERS